MSRPSSRRWPIPVRLRLFSLVASHAGGEACVCDISGDFDVTQPTISHHLKVLQQTLACWPPSVERPGCTTPWFPRSCRNLSAVLSVATDDDVRTGASA